MTITLATEFRTHLARKLLDSSDLQDLALEQLLQHLDAELLALLPNPPLSIDFDWIVLDGFKYPCLGVLYVYEAAIVQDGFKLQCDAFCTLVNKLLGFRRVLFVGTDGMTLANWDEEEWVLEDITRQEDAA